MRNIRNILLVAALTACGLLSTVMADSSESKVNGVDTQPSSTLVIPEYVVPHPPAFSRDEMSEALVLTTADSIQVAGVAKRGGKCFLTYYHAGRMHTQQVIMAYCDAVGKKSGIMLSKLIDTMKGCFDTVRKVTHNMRCQDVLGVKQTIKQIAQAFFRSSYGWKA